MELENLNHFTLRVAPDALPALRDFYVRVLGLREGARPDFPFPGHWFYAGDGPIVHLAGNAPANEAAPPANQPTGRFNHISFWTRGLKTTREHLSAHGVSWQEAPVPGVPLHQVFLRDPIGLLIELTFDAAELESAGPTPGSALPQAHPSGQ